MVELAEATLRAIEEYEVYLTPRGDYYDLPACSDAEGFFAVRRLLQKKDSKGSSRLAKTFEEAERKGIFKGTFFDGTINPDGGPFGNPFAKMALGKIKQKYNGENSGWLGWEEENKKLGQEQARFMVACNREPNDKKYLEEEGAGKWSMSKYRGCRGTPTRDSGKQSST